MAAVLRFTGDALLSGRTAGAVWTLLDWIPERPELTVVGRGAHPLAGVKVRRVARLDRQDVTWRRGLPVTAPARTIVDLAGVLTTLELESVIATALKMRLTTVPKIRDAMARAPASSPGIANLRRLLENGGFARTRSVYERRLLELIIAAQLPRPLTNHLVAGHEVDMVWLDRRLVVEFDGFSFHSDRRAFETDRRRDQDLVLAGFRVIRITARQVDEEPYAVIARLAAALLTGAQPL